MRSIVVVLCLIAIIFPFLTALAISEGVRSESRHSVEGGADIYLTLDQFGKNAPIPVANAEAVSAISGVQRAVPRVIGRMYLGNKLAVIAGIPAAQLPPDVKCVEGRPFSGPGEAVVGIGFARHFKLNVGHAFMLGGDKGKMFKVSGIFRSDSSIWASDLIFVPIEDASKIFGMEGMATDILVYTRPGYTQSVAEAVKKLPAPYRIQSRELVRSYFNRGFALKGGIFTALYTVAFALAIPALLVSSGFGLSERKREIGILKATGWQTSEVLEMVVFENLIVSLTAAPLALLMSVVWVKVFNGLFVAQFFIAEVGLFPPFDVPARFMPLPFILSFFFSVTLTMVGSLYSSWKAAVIPPAEAMRT